MTRSTAMAWGRRTSEASRRLILGLVTLSVIVGAVPAYGLITAGNRLDPTVASRSTTGEMVDVVIVIGFKPASFHMRQLQGLGSVGAVSEDAQGGTAVQLRRVTPESLAQLARTAWISRVEPMR